jgi:hypothetical protein
MQACSKSNIMDQSRLQLAVITSTFPSNTSFFPNGQIPQAHSQALQVAAITVCVGAAWDKHVPLPQTSV